MTLHYETLLRFFFALISLFVRISVLFNPRAMKTLFPQTNKKKELKNLFCRRKTIVSKRLSNRIILFHILGLSRSNNSFQQINL